MTINVVAIVAGTNESKGLSPQNIAANQLRNEVKKVKE